LFPDTKSKDVTGRIEVPTKATDHMVEAGVKAYWSFDARFEESEEVVRRIWNAMLAASRT